MQLGFVLKTLNLERLLLGDYINTSKHFFRILSHLFSPFLFFYFLGFVCEITFVREFCYSLKIIFIDSMLIFSSQSMNNTNCLFGEGCGDTPWTFLAWFKNSSFIFWFWVLFREKLIYVSFLSVWYFSFLIYYIDL